MTIIITALLMLILLIAMLILMYIYTDNENIQVTSYQITHEQIPSEFNGFRIAQVADLHNTEFGDNNSDLLSLLVESKPDIIVFTGDQIDARRLDFDIVLHFVQEAVKIAPCYLVTGNHEGSIPQTAQHLSILEDAGVIVLMDELIELDHNGATIDLIGLHDATMSRLYSIYYPKEILEMALQDLDLNKEHFTILLAHNPEFLYVYERNHIDLALCGHNHGGQIRIGDQGLISAGKKLFPKYDAGVYTLDDATMVLSRGLGNSAFPWRINNPPELVIVELNTAT